MPFSPADLKRLRDAYNEQAKNSPEPDAKILEVGTKKMSIREHAQEVEKGTPVGKRFIDQVDEAVSAGDITLDTVIKQMTGPQPRPW